MKLKFYVLAVCAVALTLDLRAQCTGNIALSSQADVDSYQSNYGCSVITGSLTISGNDITDLAGLSGITSVGTLWIINNPALENLSGLHSLTSIGSSCACTAFGLTISNNPGLSNVDGLSALTSVGGMVKIQGNPVLTNINGLSHLTHVGTNRDFGDQSIVIQSNPMITSLTPFSGLSGSIGGVYIIDNDALTDLQGLHHINKILGAGLEISGNANLTSISGLSKISTVNLRIKVSDNASLPDLNGFKSLYGIQLVRGSGVAIVVSDNPSLVNIDSLSNFQSFDGSGEQVTLTNNPRLTRGCGLFTLISKKENVCPTCVTYNFSGSGITKDQILAGGPCQPSSVPTCYLNISLSSQADVDAFSTAHGCSVVAAALTITGADITNLDGLGGVTRVQDLSIVNNPALTDVSGLSGLISVDHLAIVGNPALTNLNGLGSLATASAITISGQSLVDLSALSALDSVEDLSLSDNSIGSLHGLERIKRLKSLKITNDAALASLAGLSGLSRVDDLLLISQNQKLTTLTGLSALGYAKRLNILSNPLLTDVNGLSSLTSSVITQVTDNANLTSLQGLSGMSGYVSIFMISDNPLLTNLHGLEGITYVDVLSVQRSNGLTDLSGLALTHVGSVAIDANQNMISLNGLNNVTTIDGGACGCLRDGLKVTNNPRLTNLDVLSSVTTVKGYLYLEKNGALQNLDGLASVASIAANSNIGNQALIIKDHAVLTSIRGLRKLTRIPGKMYILNNMMLGNFAGLGKVTTINGDIIIDNNPALREVDSLSSLTTMDTGATLTVTNNHNLTRGCGLYNVLHTSNPPSTFSGNGPGVTKDQILADGPCENSTAPKICNGDIALTSQADVNAFPTTRGCTTITGMLSISGNDITDLTPLSGIDSLGSLYITNNANLENLHGLEEIKVIGHTCPCIFPGLVLDNNGKLSNIDGLSGLTSSAGLVKITNNPVLTNINGLSHLTVLGDGVDYAVQSIVIQNNPRLESLAGFSGISGTVGSIDISNNNALIDLKGLQHITSIAGYGLNITDNVLLSDIGALSKVTDVGAGIHISHNIGLQNLNGLRSLRRINIVRGGGVALVVTGNPALGNVDSLSNLTEMRGPTMTIDFSNNGSLGRGCGLFPLLNDYVQNCPDCQVTYNFSGSLVTKEEVLAGGPCPSESAGCNNNIGLSSQADVDSFRSKYGCSVINGYLFIRGADITNLDSLADIRSIDNLFIDGNPVLENVDGLSHLTTIPGILSGNPFAGLRINDNPKLTNIDGLRSLTSVGQELVITNNSSLQNIEGLASLTSVGANPQIHYLGLDLENNAALTTIAGFRNLASIKGYVDIINNDALTDFDGLQKIEQINISGLAIMDNDALKNLNGLSSLRRIYGTYSSGLKISNNASLTNVDSLSNLIDMGNPPRYLTVTDNPNLTRGCGLYNIIRTQFCAGCNGTLTLSNNGAGFTREEIIAVGPCDGNDTVSPTMPTGLMFMDVTDNSMTVSFTRGERAKGYLILMRAFESSLPDEGPVNNIFYDVGNVIGCCSIVVGKGMDTTHYIIYQEPDVDYYFDIIPWIQADMGITYFPDLALSGHQRTLPQPQPYPNPFVEELVIPVTVTDENSTVNILISDQLGRPVSQMVKTLGNAGKYEIRWNRVDSAGNKVMNGVYTYSITTPNSSMRGLVMAK
jgi:hypothetical protein